MQQEANKKSKKWLWLVIAIVAVLAVVGVVLGIVLSGSGDVGDDNGGNVDNGPKGGRADIYWNIDKASFTNATTGMSAREPEADGKYYVTFAHDGEQVKYAFTDKRLVNYIDTVDAVGLVFDDSGNVVDAVDVTTVAKEMAKGFYVVKVEGNVITLNGSATLDGLTKQITCEELTKVMNFAGERETKGELIEAADVRPLDMVIVYGNDLEQATHFAVMSSPVESAVYWRCTQFYNYSEKMTTRVPDENGIYTVEMFCNGERLSLKFRNVEDVNLVDKVTSDICHVGLIFDKDGYVVGTQPSQNGIRGRIACEQFDVTEINGNTFTATKTVGSANLIGNTYTGTLPEGTPIYDASAYYDESKRGQNVGSLQMGDRITVWEDTLGNIVEIYIYIRRVPGPIYYKVDTRGSNRPADENGWYTFEIFDGKSVRTLKTKNELMARFLEQNAFTGLTIEGDVIKDAFGYGRVVAHGYTDYGRYWYKVSSVAGMITTLVSPDGGTMLSKIVSPTCKIYNMSGVQQEIGAETTIQVGDQGVFIPDYTGQMAYAFITERTVEGTGIYYNLSRMYKSAEKSTGRTPDKNGYYVFEMAHDGKVVTIKTKSKAVATKIDYISNCLIALKPNSKGIVTDAYRVSAATGGRVQCGGQWQFECVLEDGNIQLQRADQPESKYIVKPAEGMKVYNVANVGYNKFRGEADKMEPGDHIQIVTDPNDKTVVAYIIKQTFKEVTKLCPHCNKKVKFTPWVGTNFSLIAEPSGHYYVPGHGSGISSSIMGDVPAEKGAKIVIDLNGKTVSFARGQRINIYYNEVELNLVDTVGGGKMITYGLNGGGMFNIGGYGGKMNVYGGTYVLEEDHDTITSAGVFSISGSHGTKVNFYGGKVVSKDPKIEAINISSAAVNFYDGFVAEGGVVIGNNAEVTMSGTVKISKLQINKGILLDFTKLSKKSSIGIVASGVFTTEMSASQLAAVQKILSCPVEGGSIVVEGNQLACYGTEPDYTQVYEQSIKMDFSNTEKLPTTCPFCDRAAIWEPLPEPNLESQWGVDVVLGGGKHYYLDKNRSIEGVYMLDGGDVCLHLNGKTITSTGREIFTIFYGKTLNIMGKGTVEGSGSNRDARIASVISNNGDLNICGGTYVATSKGDMPIFTNRGNTDDNNINIYDGTIKTTGIAIKTRSKNLLVAGGTINGRIIAETTTYSNPAYTEHADVVVRGGTIEKLVSNDANLDIQGGTIAGVTIATGGNGTIKLSGAPEIEELKFLVDVQVDATELTKGAKIGINKVGVFTTNFASEDAAEAAKGYFSAVQSAAEIKREGSALTCVGGAAPAPDEPTPEPKPEYNKTEVQRIIDAADAMTFPTDGSDKKAECPYCKKTVTWKGIKDASKGMMSGHYYLANDISVTNSEGALYFGQWEQNGVTQDVCLHLNGKKLINASLPAIRVWTNYRLNILGDGYVQSSGAGWGALDVAPAGAIVNVYGGTYHSTSNYRTVAAKKGTLNLYNANVENGFVWVTDASAVSKVNVFDGTYNEIRMDSADDKVTVLGGTIKKLTATSAVYVYGGKIDKLIGSAGNSVISLEGKPVIGELDMTATNIKLTVGELATGADITVKANKGVFTKNFASEAKATAAKAFFTGISGEVEVAGKALAFTPATTPTPDPDPNPDPVVMTPAQIIAAANAMTFPADGSDYTAVCPACGVSVTWKGLKDTTDDATHTINGHYYLAENLVDERTTETIVVSANGKLCLHLNGKSIDAANSGSWSAAVRGNAAGLNIMGSGTVNGNASAAVRANGLTNIYGGVYTASNAHAVFEIRNAANEAINFYDGKITSGDVRMNGDNATFNMYGGEYTGSGKIKGNQAKTGMTVVICDGAKITATGGITTYYINLDIRGGEISKIETNASCQSFKISGEPVIGELNMSVVSEKGWIQVGELGENAEIGIKANGVFTKDFADAASAKGAKKHFTSLDVTKGIDVDGKALTCIDASLVTPEELTPAQIIAAANAMTFPTDGSNYTAGCPVCGKSVTWTALSDTEDATTILASGHYYLAENITFTGLTTGEGYGYYLNNAATEVCLHRNGKTITAVNSGRCYTPIRVAAGSLNLMGEGLLTNDATNWAALDASGSVNVYGGNFFNNTGNRRAISVKAGTTNLYNVTVEKGWVYSTGGTVNVESGTYEGAWANNANAVININGGTLTSVNNSINTMAGTENINGGTITTLIVKDTAGTITLSGTPVITTVDMTAAGDVKLTIGELTEGASIAVKAADGAFTTAFANEAAAEVAHAFITAKEEGKVVVVKENALAIIDASQIDPNEAIILAAKAMTFPVDKTDKTATCPKCGEEVTWKAMTDEMINTSTSRQYKGHYYLAENVNFTTEAALAINSNGKLCLHLNGKSFSNPTTGGWSAVIRGNTELNIFDNGNGSINGNASAAIWANCPVNIYGGTYTANNANAVFELRGVAGEAINFYDGKITSGDIRMNGDNAAFKMYGGEFSGTGKIKGNGAKTGMTVGIYGGKVTATGGITGYYLNIEVAGGEVNKVVSGATTQSIKISGDPVITELDVTVSGSPMVEVGTLTGGNVSVKANGVFTKDFADATAQENAKTFIKPIFGQVIENSGLALKCAARTAPYSAEEIVAGSAAQVFAGTDDVQAPCYACGQLVTWKALTQESFTTGVKTGHYYLAENITNDQNTAMINATSGLCLHLNGKSITTTGTNFDARCINSATNGVINIFDSANGSVNGSATSAAVWVNGGTINVYGGIFTAAVSNGTLEIRSGSFNLYAGEVTGNRVRMNNAAAEFNMYGGELTGGGYIYGNKESGCGTVTIYGGTISATDGIVTRGLNLVVSGGTINKITAHAATLSITISGKPVIANLDMTASPVKATVGTLETGASIGVTADGEFTNDVADVNAAKAFFSAVASDKKIDVAGQKLTCVPAA